MKRYNAFTIKVETLDSVFWEWLANAENEYALECEQIGYDVFWFSSVPKELFQFANEFEWVSGSAKLWVNEELVTKNNYRTKVWDIEPDEMGEGGEWHWEILDWNLMTDIAPVVEQEI